ncbi:unnamed protein product [Zymoseptoria tritici ST99CH_1A5]|uniref:RRM domain-containing protein n=2 Tax=Zymoseptoria tritici TaxID=1047171 RepID=A0A1X7SA96_ZYMT9|nr:unnamed protein product [Zymoseptoria tritici ST99CH_3D7]SMY29851.1 unnamed protein product [Zymoseptoria tritici ST99CH_1A5]
MDYDDTSGFNIRGRAHQNSTERSSSPTRRDQYRRSRSPRGYQDRGGYRGRYQDDDYRRSDHGGYGGRQQSYRRRDDRDDTVVERPPTPEEWPPASMNGDSDVATSGQPLQFLLIRDLKPNVTSAILSKGLEKLYRDEVQAGVQEKPQINSNLGATPGSLKRVFIVRERGTSRSLQFGFAEFHSKVDATAALAKFDERRAPLTIASKNIQVNLPHAGIFVPADPSDREAFELRQGDFRKYRAPGYFADAFYVNREPPYRSPSPVREQPVKPEKKQTTTSLEVKGSTDRQTANPVPVLALAAGRWQKSGEQLRRDLPRPATETDAPADNQAGPAERESYAYFGDKVTKGGERQAYCFICEKTWGGEKEGLWQHLSDQGHAEQIEKEAQRQRARRRMDFAGVVGETLRL